MTDYKPDFYSIRLTTDEEFKNKMPYITSSMMEAMATCPRWGVIHSVHNRRFVTGYRQMALEAGSLMHDVLCMLNLLHIGYHRNLPDHMHFHGEVNFNTEENPNRWKQIFTSIVKDFDLDDTLSIERPVFETIATSNFYDDPNDRNRTVSNLELCAMELLNYWRSSLIDLPIYVADEKDPTKPIGIEMSLDAVFEFPVTSIERLAYPGVSTKLRAIGLADVVYQNPDTKKVTLGEYKTASNMNDAWRMAFDTRHQQTLYNALLQAYFGYQRDFSTILIGSAIPVRTTAMPVQHFPVYRDQDHIKDMLNTYIHLNHQIEENKDNPTNAPMYTHSCNRYFRPCSLIDLCSSTCEDREIIFEQMQIAQTLSPSEEKAMMRNM